MVRSTWVLPLAEPNYRWNSPSSGGDLKFYADLELPDAEFDAILADRALEFWAEQEPLQIALEYAFPVDKWTYSRYTLGRNYEQSQRWRIGDQTHDVRAGDQGIVGDCERLEDDAMSDEPKAKQRGGARPGAGRKFQHETRPPDQIKSQRWWWVTEAEAEAIDRLLDRRRTPKATAPTT